MNCRHPAFAWRTLPHPFALKSHDSLHLKWSIFYIFLSCALIYKMTQENIFVQSLQNAVWNCFSSGLWWQEPGQFSSCRVPHHSTECSLHPCLPSFLPRTYLNVSLSQESLSPGNLLQSTLCVSTLQNMKPSLFHTPTET